MRADPAEFDFVAPPNLQAALKLLSAEPGAWLPIAGGTDVMVQFGAGTLAARKLLSLWNLPELRRIDILPDHVEIGAGSTYSDLRGHEVLGREFPLLVRAASWTGGIANQNRGTLGGNIVNASPAGDSLPALLAYDSELILVSVRGERRIAYRDFHQGYKKMNLAADELLRAVCLPRKFSAYFSYTRKVGARRAQAISKICIAALGHIEKNTVAGAIHISVEDARIAVGSVAPTPIRLTETERVLNGKRLDESLVKLARKAAVAEIRPISDIRSTGSYRAAVVSNLVGEFLLMMSVAGSTASHALARWNRLPAGEAENEILPCCGSRGWARAMVGRRPIASEVELLAAADEIWRGLGETDWAEAFRSHPRIGESGGETASPTPNTTARSAMWSAKEQSGVAQLDEGVKNALANANHDYEKNFGRIFIICATGKSAPEILAALRQRLQSDEGTELREAAEQQRQIMQIRLKKWLTE
ncbi:MAG TPA: 2-oxo-4-hydroxy-4-carboxy-5-ureidoimidazoline decarboxylase [Terriglobia bacterium]|nr:2-oxo-4-hydroxy-4-carboxy-5-ureidoimidazoline decarboxylase [Terriglobia bacterium]